MGVRALVPKPRGNGRCEWRLEDKFTAAQLGTGRKLCVELVGEECLAVPSLYNMATLSLSLSITFVI